MKRRHFVGVAAAALGTILTGTLAVSQSQPPTEGPAIGETPAWFLQGSFPDPTGRTIVDAERTCHGPPAAVDPAAAGAAPTPPLQRRPSRRRRHAVARRCAASAAGRARQSLQRVQWKQTMGYTFTYPYVLPPGFGGVPAVALDSKGNLWVFQRADAGKPQLFKFDPNHKLILQVGPDVIGYQDKAHGMAVDAEDNVWITAADERHGDEDQPRGEAAPDDRRAGTPRGLG